MIRESESKKKLSALNKRLREYLIDKDDAYYYFFKNSFGFNVIVSKDGDIVDVNHRVVRELGYDEENIKGKNVLDFVHKDYVKSTKFHIFSDDKFDEDFSFTNVWVGMHGNKVKIRWSAGYLGVSDLIYAMGDVLHDDVRK